MPLESTLNIAGQASRRLSQRLISLASGTDSGTVATDEVSFKHQRTAERSLPRQRSRHCTGPAC